MHRDPPEEAVGVGLIALFLVLMGKPQRALGEDVRLLQATGEELCFTQRQAAERLKACHIRPCGQLYRLGQRRHSVGDAPRQGIGCPHGCCHARHEEPEICFSTDA